VPAVLPLEEAEKERKGPRLELGGEGRRGSSQ